MAKTIGVILSDRILTGLVTDHALQGRPLAFPEDDGDGDGLVELHADLLVETVCQQVTKAEAGDGKVEAIGVALPGLIRNGVVEESPNLPQLKGARVGELLEGKLRANGITAPVTVLNDADGVAAGLASAAGQAGQRDPGVDAGGGDRVWAVPVSAGVVGSGALGGDAGRQGALLRVRRARAHGRHHGAPGDAAAVSGYGAGRGV